MTCKDCGQEFDPLDSLMGDEGQCQMCWEAYCDRQFWKEWNRKAREAGCLCNSSGTLSCPLHPTDLMRRRTLREWLSDQIERVRIWWFDMRSVEATITRACGHTETARVLRKWIARWERTDCPECVFRASLAGDKGRL